MPPCNQLCIVLLLANERIHVMRIDDLDLVAESLEASLPVEGLPLYILGARGSGTHGTPWRRKKPTTRTDEELAWMEAWR